MICVIADDFTGAAEIGGVALRYGLSVELQSAFCPDADVELICIDADTRSCSPQEAARRAAAIARRCRAASIRRVFKKVDSVLRGQVAAELLALMPVLGKRRALLVPANPSLGRVISGGQYLVNGMPLHRTGFARDPEYPATTSGVLQMLGVPAHLARVGDELPPDGIVVGEAAVGTDVKRWAREIDVSTLPAGAADLFACFLEENGYTPATGTPEGCIHPITTNLFVCGSTSDYSRGLCQRFEAAGVPVVRIPLGLLENGVPAQRLLGEWTDAALRALDPEQDQTELHGRATCSPARIVAMLAVDRPLRREPGLPQRLSGYLATVVQRVLERRTVDRIYVEGGATAISLIRRLGWQRMLACREWAPGVVSLRVSEGSGPLLTMKPGSYAWPAHVDTLAPQPTAKGGLS